MIKRPTTENRIKIVILRMRRLVQVETARILWLYKVIEEEGDAARWHADWRLKYTISRDSRGVVTGCSKGAALVKASCVRSRFARREAASH